MHGWMTYVRMSVELPRKKEKKKNNARKTETFTFNLLRVHPIFFFSFSFCAVVVSVKTIYATRQGARSHSRLSSLSHRGLLLA